jgi:hypothetical protein
MDIEKLLNTGLKEGFAGGTIREGVERGGFNLESSHLERDEGKYHDEWMAGRVGGGQELVEINGEYFTRVYAGGTISDEELKNLGITGKEVIGQLKNQLLENSDLIRLKKDFLPEPDRDFQYKCEVIDNENEIPVTTVKESISYKGKTVFIHILVLCPVEI